MKETNPVPELFCFKVVATIKGGEGKMHYYVTGPSMVDVATWAQKTYSKVWSIELLGPAFVAK